MTASDTVLREIDLAAASIAVSGPFRVGIEFTEGGLPSVATDTDGTIDEANDFVELGGLGWSKATNVGLAGDFVIRAVVPEPNATLAGSAALAALALTAARTRAPRARSPRARDAYAAG